MSTRRKNYSSEFKAKIALEAIKGFTSINDIAREYKIHPNQISQWKKQLLEMLPSVFDNPCGPKTDGSLELVEQLYRQIGKLHIEVDLLKKKITSHSVETLKGLIEPGYDYFYFIKPFFCNAFFYNHI